MMAFVTWGCKGNFASRRPDDGSHESSSEDEGHKDGAGESEYLASIAPLPTTPVMPQCVQQRHAPSEQLAPSYFEQMQPCSATLPPQLRASASGEGHGGSLDGSGDCNLGKAGATEVVCHYHTSYEFTSRDTEQVDPGNTIEVHCIAFKLAAGERQSKPIVFGTQLSCKAGTLPGSGLAAAAAAGEHGGEHGGAASCGARLPEIFADVQTCDMRCCRDGTLTKANPGMAIRPSFAICAAPRREVDCSGILANMHAHAPHRPHDRVGPTELYGQATPGHLRGNNKEHRSGATGARKIKSTPVSAPIEGEDGVEDMPW